MSTHTSPMPPTAFDQDQRKTSLDKRLATLFWPLLLILLGTIWLFPEGQVPAGTWLIGIGAILLGLNATRMLNHIPVRMLPTALGAIALAGGLAEYAGVNLPIVALTFIAIGAAIVLELVAPRKP